MILEMIDIGRQVESVGKKHLENEKSCLENRERETKVGRKKMGAFFQECSSHVAMILTLL